MYNYKKLAEDLYWIGGSDRRIALFENVYPVPEGVSYNSYLFTGEKTVLVDTVDRAVAEVFFENLAALLGDRPLDYLIVNHMEPDHAATMAEVVLRYPQVQIVCNTKTQGMIGRFFNFTADFLTVKEGDTLSAGSRSFTFVMAPMVHWPEVMMTFETTGGILFSADAFGTFGALNGPLFADEAGFDMAAARRYYANIVGKYGTQVQAVLKKTAGLELRMICPLHGPVHRGNFNTLLEKYDLWSRYQPEEQAVLIAYASVYGNTQNAAELLANRLADRGVKNIRLYDVSVTHPSYLVAEAFRCSHLVFASTTYNAGIFVSMENLLHDLMAHNLQNRTVTLLENGSWAPTAGSLMRGLLEKGKNMTFLGETVTIRSALKETAAIEQLADEIAESLKPKAVPKAEAKALEQEAFFKLSYGLYALSAKDRNGDNACIINTAVQLTDEPKQLAIAVNKANHTHDMILETGLFNLSVLTEETPYALIQRFGFQSGRDTDKFSDYSHAVRSENGLLYLTEATNAVLSGKVIEARDCGTHTLFVAEVTEAKTLSARPSLTYAYYFAHIKPKPQAPAAQKSGYVCTICGYVYEGEELPADFICPLCKHGAADFEKLPEPQPEAPKKTVYECQICGFAYEGEELPADYVYPLCNHGAEHFKKVEK